MVFVYLVLYNVLRVVEQGIAFCYMMRAFLTVHDKVIFLRECTF